MEKDRLLQIAKELEPSEREESFYRFAQKYIMHLQQKGTANAKEFFAVVAYCKRKSQSPSVRNLLGLRGRDFSLIAEWCDKILNNQKLQGMNLNELGYVFGCCARLAKAAWVIRTCSLP